MGFHLVKSWFGCFVFQTSRKYANTLDGRISIGRIILWLSSPARLNCIKQFYYCHSGFFEMTEHHHLSFYCKYFLPEYYFSWSFFPKIPFLPRIYSFPLQCRLWERFRYFVKTVEFQRFDFMKHHEVIVSYCVPEWF